MSSLNVSLGLFGVSEHMSGKNSLLQLSRNLVLPHVLSALMCEPLQASLLGGNGNVDLNELLKELAL
jgi:hypothetical protein